ncbi:MAG: hypothetical protein C6W57_11145 [Caldibacillus debilis]|nr:MAG: hypothetical protein C6W57_11145 [Caldibacillus debilis]
MHDKRNKDKGWREFPSSGKSGAEERGVFRHGRSRISGIFPPGTAAGGTVFSTGRQRDFSRFRGADFRQLGAGQEAGRYVPFGKKDIPDRASGSVRIRVSDFPAVSAIGTSRRAGPLAGGIPIPPAPERPGEPRA